jgi:hypothetical protein
VPRAEGDMLRDCKAETVQASMSTAVGVADWAAAGPCCSGGGTAE